MSNSNSTLLGVAASVGFAILYKTVIIPILDGSSKNLGNNIDATLEKARVRDLETVKFIADHQPPVAK